MSWEPTADEIADRYADTRVRVVGLLADLSEEREAANVPGTPKWSVRDLAAHFVGAPTDLLAGNVEGAGSEAWTQAQVEARRDRTMADLLEEWEQAMRGLDGAIRGGNVPAPVAFDVITHEQDLRGAIGAPPTPDPLAMRFVTAGFASRVDHVVAAAGLPPVEFRDPAGQWSLGTPGGVVVEAPEFECFRALTGRRSGHQVAAFAWSGDPAPYLDLLSPFGPLRDTDVTD